MVHKIRLMATTYAALRKWAADAGLSAEQSMLDRFITPIAGLTATGRLTFKLKNFRIAKEVRNCDGRRIFTSTLVWPGGVMVKALACDSRDREFNSRPSRCQVTTLGKLFTHTCLCHQAV